jgi:pimeloyl-ACP methyl ester carboxylesterase
VLYCRRFPRSIIARDYLLAIIAQKIVSVLLAKSCQYVNTKDSQDSICNSPRWTKLSYHALEASTGNPLLFLMHFRGTMDHWDPLLINAIAAQRNVILYDYQGYGRSTPADVKTTIYDMATDVLRFFELIGVTSIDVLGFSIGGMVAQLIALNANPKTLEVRKIVLGGTAPSAGPDLQTSPNQAGIVTHAGAKQVAVSDVEVLFFSPSREGKCAAEGYWSRLHERDLASSGEERIQYLSHDLIDGGAGMGKMLNALVEWATPDTSQELKGSYNRLADLKIPVLVANGHVSCFSYFDH